MEYVGSIYEGEYHNGRYEKKSTVNDLSNTASRVCAQIEK